MIDIDRSKKLPISLVVPVHDEILYLTEFFKAVGELDPIASDILIIKTLDSVEINILLDHCLAEFNLKVRKFTLTGAYPGEARNYGIARANFDRIAFLDVGVYPPANWLDLIWRQSLTTGCGLVFGSCRFVPDAGLPAMVCASSYGTKNNRTVLPGSLIAKSIFDKVGVFRDGVRSGEDIAWFNEVNVREIPTDVCDAAVLEYRHFERTMTRVCHKAFVYEISGKRGFRTCILLGYFGTYPLAFFHTELAITCLTSYLALRGVIDPIRRSGYKWGSASQMILMPFFVGVLDAVKAIGHLIGLVGFRLKPVGRGNESGYT